MVTSYADPVLWAVVVTIGVLTYAIRLSFVALFGYVEDIPRGVERALRYVPAAVLAALVLPAFVTLDAGLAADKLVAGALAVAVAWYTEDALATMAVGMGALWTVRFLLVPAV